MKKRVHLLYLLLLVIVLCFRTSGSIADPAPYRQPWDYIVVSDEFLKDVTRKYELRRSKNKKGGDNSPISEDEKNYVLQVAKYLIFLDVESKPVVLQQALTTLFKSNPFFLLCNPQDWDCLEKYPFIKSLPDYRKDISESLGEPLDAGDSFDFNLYFSPVLEIDGVKQDRMITHVVDELQKSNKEILLNIFGIDDVDGTLKPVMDVITEKVQPRADGSRVDVRAIVDQKDESAKLRTFDVVDDPNKPGFPKLVPLKKKLIQSYLPPTDEALLPYWVFGRPAWMSNYSSLADEVWEALKKEARDKGYELAGYSGGYVSALQDLKNVTKDSDMVRMAFQYKGTIRLLELLNSGIRDDEESKGRVEWPSDDIEHNKFIVMDSNRVWTGTTNISENELGSDKNINVGIMFNNSVISNSYRDEFFEMFNFSSDYNRDQIENTFRIGKLHKNKSVNTNRYFKFCDGTDVRVHFAPTDDAEHRVIIPFLYSAQSGDHIRILMFGNSGIELIRAIQHALSRGVDVSMLLDATSAGQASSWVSPKNVANICEENPYKKTGVKLGNLLVYLDEWSGFLHVKGASIARLINGTQHVTDLIVGSQNWAGNGNNANDENMISIRNATSDLPELIKFNLFFEQLKTELEKDGNVLDPCKDPDALDKDSGTDGPEKDE